MEYLEGFDVLHGFKFRYAENGLTDDKRSEITVLHFANEKHVAIDVVVDDNGCIFLGEPYAIDSEGTPVRGEFFVSSGNYEGIVKPSLFEDTEGN